MVQYYEQLHHDLRLLYPDKHIISQPKDSHQLMVNVKRSMLSPAIDACERPDYLATGIAQAIAHAATTDHIPAYRGSLYAACSNSEAYVIDSVHPSSIKDSGEFSPVLLTCNDEPVVIHKSTGDPTGYALETVPELGLVCGYFYMFRNRIKPKQLGRTNHAFRAELSADTEAGYLRASAFLVPLSERLPLISTAKYDTEKLLLETGHDTLRRFAQLAMRRAIAIDQD
jgi:hypothetical protein